MYKQRSTKHTNKANDRVTRTPLKSTKECALLLLLLSLLLLLLLKQFTVILKLI